MERARGTTMTRVAIALEGSTEEAFVNVVLSEHLRTKGIAVRPILLGDNVTVQRLSSYMPSFERVGEPSGIPVASTIPAATPPALRSRQRQGYGCHHQQ